MPGQQVVQGGLARTPMSFEEWLDLPEKPKAESPSTQTIRLSGFVTAAATAKPRPTPIVPKVPASSRVRGS